MGVGRAWGPSPKRVSPSPGAPWALELGTVSSQGVVKTGYHSTSKMLDTAPDLPHGPLPLLSSSSQAAWTTLSSEKQSDLRAAAAFRCPQSRSVLAGESLSCSPTGPAPGQASRLFFQEPSPLCSLV